MRTLSWPDGWWPKLFLLGVILVFIGPVGGCVTTMSKMQSLPPYEINLNIKGVDAVKVEEAGDGIHQSMEVKNDQGSLTFFSFYCGDKLFTTIFSALSVGDVKNLWNDRIVTTETTDIREWHLFINSPGGDAFTGLALADEIEKAKNAGFTVIAHASGIVASAALPIFAVCNERIAGSGTIFMVHETSIWKWPGRETASDIRSQNELMDLLRERYITKMEQYSNLSKEEWEELGSKNTWFSAEQAQEWGLVDSIE